MTAIKSSWRPCSAELWLSPVSHTGSPHEVRQSAPIDVPSCCSCQQVHRTVCPPKPKKQNMLLIFRLATGPSGKQAASSHNGSATQVPFTSLPLLKQET
eukprot:6174116-Pleurochrysis_carterae.AAC.2